MAEATTITVTPKQLGRHLRSIRRKKGLSLAEVARGAGLSRRELVAYERGKAPIPESDLWVLAGSCGVDVAELMPSTSSLELAAAANRTSVGDTVSQLRRRQEDAGITPYLHTLHKLRALPAGKRIPVKDRELDEIATALGSTPRSIVQRLQEVLHVSPDEAERLRAMILVPPDSKRRPRALAAAPIVTSPPAAAATMIPFTAPAPAFVAERPAESLPTFAAAPAAFLDQPFDAPIDALQGQNVDVFEELARLPEPVPLGDPSAPMPDLLAPPDPLASPFVATIGPPDGAVELVDTTMPSAAAAGASAWSADEAPPIDVAMRQGSATWDLGEPPLAGRPDPVDDRSTWETDGWQPPAPEGATGTPVGFWESTDDWAASVDTGAPEALGVVDSMPDEPLGMPNWTESVSDAEPPWASEALAGADTDVNPWVVEEWPQEPADLGAWDHRPDPAAIDTGFYVDWGTPDTETPPGWGAFDEPSTPAADPVGSSEATGPVVVDGDAAWEQWLTMPDATAVDVGDAPVDAPVDVPVDVLPAWDQWAATPAVEEPEAIDRLEQVDDHDAFATPVVETFALTHISWRADTAREPDIADAVTDDDYTHDADDEILTADVLPVAEWDEPVRPWSEAVSSPPVDADGVVERFVTAGPDWQLGNALPLVEVRGQGGLVMRRADERWALADVSTTSDFVAEVEVDFRSGPGLGVLFRASTDEDGRMSGYSFDIDPIYDGGGYLVRQWHADRELWNPIARVNGDDPAAMYGTLLVRLELVGEHLRAVVNGVEVLTVENLKQASTDRGRDPATGDRVGVQAWSSSDLVIDNVRVASI